MIKLSDGILKYIFDKQLKGDNLVVYLLISRYLTEEENIPLDRVQRISGFTIEGFNKGMEELLLSKIIVARREKGKWYLKDTLQSREQRVILENTPAKNTLQRAKSNKNNILSPLLQSLDHSADDIIYSNNKNLREDSNKNRYRKSKESNQSKDSKGAAEKKSSSALQSDIEIEKAKIQVHREYMHCLRRLRDTALSKEAWKLVDYFAEQLVVLYKRRLSKQWRTQQAAVAKRLLRDYKDLTRVDWENLIDYFTKQQFWRDKLNSLKQVERNMHQYYGKEIQKSSHLIVTGKEIIR